MTVSAAFLWDLHRVLFCVSLQGRRSWSVPWDALMIRTVSSSQIIQNKHSALLFVRVTLGLQNTGAQPSQMGKGEQDRGHGGRLKTTWVFFFLLLFEIQIELI